LPSVENLHVSVLSVLDGGGQQDRELMVKDLANYFPVIAEVFVPRGPVMLSERVGDCAVAARFFGAGGVVEPVAEYLLLSSDSLSSPTVRPAKPAASKYMEFPTT